MDLKLIFPFKQNYYKMSHFKKKLRLQIRNNTPKTLLGYKIIKPAKNIETNAVVILMLGQFKVSKSITEPRLFILNVEGFAILAFCHSLQRVAFLITIYFILNRKNTDRDKLSQIEKRNGKPVIDAS